MGEWLMVDGGEGDRRRGLRLPHWNRRKGLCDECVDENNEGATGSCGVG